MANFLLSNHKLNLPFLKVAGLLLAISFVFTARAHSNIADTTKNPVEDKIEEDSVTSLTAEVFRLLPDKDIDLLTTSMRTEMIIYMAADSIYKARNIYAGLSWIEKMTPGYMRVHLTDVSSLQIKMLDCPKLKGKLAMTIYTISGDSETADSTIKFYNLTDEWTAAAKLTELPANKYFRLPDPKAFYDLKNAPKDMSLSSVLQEMPFHTVAYEISPAKIDGEDILTGRLTVSNYLTLEQRKKIDPYIRPILKWRWTGKNFVLLK